MELHRLNYIGSKFKLLEWLEESILGATGWASFEGKSVADLFAGTGVVSYFLRTKKARVVSNDVEPYSSVITKALTLGVYSTRMKLALRKWNEALNGGAYKEYVGPVTRHYSPYDTCERKFFTVENARRIDWVRAQIEAGEYGEVDKAFLLASLLVSADAVSNVPAVYGCYLQKFKAKAEKALVLSPIHSLEEVAVPGSAVWGKNVLDLGVVACDAVYLDPPYNERQYSKNYFPLNIIAKSPADAEITCQTLGGKTGIPKDCFISPFCRGKEVTEAFKKLVSQLNCQYIFLSYNNESLISKDDMIKILSTKGTVGVLERVHKRFKNYEYNEGDTTTEYLFCVTVGGGGGYA